MEPVSNTHYNELTVAH